MREELVVNGSSTGRHLSRRSFLSQIGVAGAGVAALTSCAGLTRDEPDVTTQKPAGSKKKAGNVSISILDRPNTTEQGRLDAYDETVRMFQAKFPTIKLDVQTMLDGGDMVKTLPAKLANGTMETLFSMAPEDGSLYAGRQQLALIDEAAATWDGFDQLRADVLDHNRDAAGKLFGLPCRHNSRGIYYSRARFEAAGLDPDSPPLTWDEFREAAGKLTNRGKNQYGFGDVGGPDAAISFLNWFYSAGGQVQVTEGDKWKAQLDSPEAKTVLTLMHDMRWKDQTIAPVLYKAFGDDLIGEIATGRVAMAVHAPTGTADIREFGAKLEDFSFGPTPQNGGNAVFEALVSFCFAPNATPEQLKAGRHVGRVQAVRPGGSRVQAQGDEGRGLLRCTARGLRRRPPARLAASPGAGRDPGEVRDRLLGRVGRLLREDQELHRIRLPAGRSRNSQRVHRVDDGSDHDRQERRHRRVAG